MAFEEARQLIFGELVFFSQLLVCGLRDYFLREVDLDACRQEFPPF